MNYMIVEICEVKSSGAAPVIPAEVKISFTRDSTKASRLVLSRKSEVSELSLDV